MNEALLARIRAHPHWYHSFDLGDGERIVGWWEQAGAPPGALWHEDFRFYHLPDDLTGRSVLDIGGWDGALAFECERRGAHRVVLLNLPDYLGQDFPATGYTAERHRREALERGSPHLLEEGYHSRGAALIKAWRDSNVEIRAGSVYDLPMLFEEPFDLVLCCGVLYHLKHPVLALEACRGVARGGIVVHCYMEPMFRHRPWPYAPFRWIAKRFGRKLFTAPYLTYLGGQNPSINWWCLPPEVIERMLEDTGFAAPRVEERQGRHFVVSASV